MSSFTIGEILSRKKSPHKPSLHVAFEKLNFLSVHLSTEKKNRGWRTVIFQEYQDFQCHTVEVSPYSSLCQVPLSTVCKELFQFYP